METADIGVDNMAQAVGQGLGPQARYGADSALMVQFYKHPKMDQERSKEEGRPIFKEVDFVRIMSPGNKENIIERQATDLDKARFVMQYQRYQANEEQGVEGTPLEEWPQITRSQVEELRYFNVRTVEQLVEMSDSNAQKFMGIQAMKQKAEEFLGAAKAPATQAELEQANTQIEQLRAQLDAVLMGQQEAKAAAVAASAEKDEGEDVDKPRRRGRPPKTE